MTSDEDKFYLYGFVLAVVIGLIVIVDYANSQSVLIGSGKVVQRTFVPSTTSTGYTNAGKGGFVVSSTDEEWTIVVDINGEPTPVHVDKHEWSYLDVGAVCDVYKRVGKIFSYGKFARR